MRDSTRRIIDLHILSFCISRHYYSLHRFRNIIETIATSNSERLRCSLHRTSEVAWHSCGGGEDMPVAATSISLDSSELIRDRLVVGGQDRSSPSRSVPGQTLSFQIGLAPIT
ncbi:hypothetical protein SCLCIDRAFT_176702 [Scleroderma citrinum Foug A]|uniref:Uncharacterized protein n=1 Tax=Scleroderma citrinum Foug A TaxID=1036808 RepID=A0A0C3ESV8_9AGAM|nr:hypothetical protein SCLCIDRAFT_176702 [Scleroderma citrinum Foug A]